MSAETLGQSLLKGLKEEGLDEFLQSLRNSDTSYIVPPTRLPPLDHLLQIFQNPSSWRSQQPSSHRTTLDPSLPHPQQQTLKGPSPPVLELTSATACSGKTQLLHKIITLALLPGTHGAIPIGGRSSAVILLDIRSNISILRLREVMTAHIATCVSKFRSPPLSPQEINSLIHAALLHLHVFRPQSSASLTATLAHLPDHFFAQPYEHFSASRPIGALVLANLTAFYWQDRLQASDPAQHQLIPNPNLSIDNTNNYRKLVSTLRSLQRSFSCPIITTTSTLSTPSSLPERGNRRILRPNMPLLWTSFVTAQVVLERVLVPKFAPGISAQEASEERALRQGAVAQGERRGWVNWWGEGAWREEVREGVRRWERDWEGGLRFWIGEGVAVGGEE